jgi:hypothetical protein
MRASAARRPVHGRGGVHSLAKEPTRRCYLMAKRSARVFQDTALSEEESRSCHTEGVGRPGYTCTVSMHSAC